MIGNLQQKYSSSIFHSTDSNLVLLDYTKNKVELITFLMILIFDLVRSQIPVAKKTFLDSQRSQFMLVYYDDLVNLIRQLKCLMNRRHRSINHVQEIPEIIAVSANTIVRAARSRFFHQRERHSRPIYFLKNSSLEPSYETAKKAETLQRNLVKALRMYAKSASEGEKIDSCIKDFASVLHQMGYTKEAIGFLSNVKEYYEGDSQRFEHLEMTLQKQIVPSGKHDCRSLLFELPKKQKPSMEFIGNLFQNTTRIKKIKAFNHLALSEDSEEEGKWIVLEFESFSAAKKTLEKFKFDEWFGIKKYWMRGNMVLCAASDGRQDFEKGLVVSKDLVSQVIMKCFALEDKITWTEMDKLMYYNECAMMLIEKDLTLAAIQEEKELALKEEQ